MLPAAAVVAIVPVARAAVVIPDVVAVVIVVPVARAVVVCPVVVAVAVVAEAAALLLVVAVVAWALALQLLHVCLRCCL